MILNVVHENYPLDDVNLQSTMDKKLALKYIEQTIADNIAHNEPITKVEEVINYERRSRQEKGETVYDLPEEELDLLFDKITAQE